MKSVETIPRGSRFRVKFPIPKRTPSKRNLEDDIVQAIQKYIEYLKSFRRKRLYPNCNGAPVKYSLIAGRNKFLISNLLPIMNPNTIIKIITVVGAILTGVGEILKELNDQQKLGAKTDGTKA